MLRLLSIALLLLVQVNASQRMRILDFNNMSKNELFDTLAQMGAPVDSGGRCSLPMLCGNMSTCNKTISGINNATTPQDVTNALKGSCLVLCKDMSACANSQMDSLRKWLAAYQQAMSQGEINRQKDKKRTYKSRAIQLQAQLDRARRNLDNIDRRMASYLQRIGITPHNVVGNINTSIHQKISQVFANSQNLRGQINQLEADIQAREVQIGQLKAANQAHHGNIARLQNEISEKQDQINAVNAEIENLSKAFDELLNQTLDLQAVVDDFGLDLQAYSSQLHNINGELATKIADLTRISNLMRNDAAVQADRARQRNEAMLTQLREAIQELNEHSHEVNQEAQRLQGILEQLEQVS